MQALDLLVRGRCRIMKVYRGTPFSVRVLCGLQDQSGLDLNGYFDLESIFSGRRPAEVLGALRKCAFCTDAPLTASVALGKGIPIDFDADCCI